ncbi:hypothetical protein V6N13_084505 [Hibiscus sabdariffa]
MSEYFAFSSGPESICSEKTKVDSLLNPIQIQRKGFGFLLLLILLQSFGSTPRTKGIPFVIRTTRNGMALSAVSSAVTTIGNLIANEAISLWGLEDQVNRLQTELKRMLRFLKEADSRQGESERIRLLVSEVRELAYDAEDVVEVFALKIGTRRKGTGFSNTFKRWACIVNEGWELYRTRSNIEMIVTRISDLTRRLQASGVQVTREGEESSSSSLTKHDFRQTYPRIIEANVVGLEDEIEELVSVLLNDQGLNHRLVSICGPGGVGKTTLAKKIYQHGQVRGHFDHMAWVYVSQQCQRRKVLEDILAGLVSSRKSVGQLSDSELKAMLLKLLQEKRCLVILDDIWLTEDWDSLRTVCPMADETRSKILFTSRNREVASHADYLLQLAMLNEGECWELLRKTAFPNTNSSEYKVDPKMEELGKDMVKLCHGLPLGILVLGGILTRKCSVNEWQTVLQALKSYPNRGDGPWIAGVLARGKEDGGETAEDVAEGYLMELVDRHMIQVGERDAATLKIETFQMHDVMRDLCLEKARQENFIFVVHQLNARSLFFEKRKDRENARSLFLQKKRKGNACLLYLQKKRKEGNACLPYLRKKKQQQQQQQQRQQQEEEEENTRSLLSTPTVRRISAIEFIPMRRVYTPRLRSLLFSSDFFLSDVIRESETWTMMNLCGGHGDPTSQILNYEGAWRYTCKHFKLLRVLNYEETINIEGECKLPSNIGNLIHLRFLSLRALSLQNLKLPSSLGNLISLETLDLRVGDTVHVPYVLSRKKRSPVQVPDVIWRMEQLRHLYLPHQCKTKTRLKLGTLRNLQTLVNFNTDICYLKDLIKMVNIRVLEIRGPFKIDDFDTEDLDKNPPIVQGKHLHSLSISSYKRIDPAHLTHLLSTCVGLCKLSLDAEISKLPEYHYLSANLAHIYLRWCKLEEDPMLTLEKLPDLRVLEMGNFAFVGKEMVCHGQGFPKLHCLSLWGLNYLEEWKVDDGAMPSLRRLKISYCPDLKLLQLPDRLKMLL